MRTAASTASSTLVTVPLSGWRIPSCRAIASNRRRSSAMSIDSGDVPQDAHAGCLESSRQLQRRLSAELHDHA